MRRDECGLDLGGHAARADAVAAGRAERDRREVGLAVDGVDQLGGPGARVAVVHAVDVGQQDQRVGPRDVRDEGREPVVVAEADLLGGDRVVLVDDRQHAERQQPVDRLLGVPVVAAPREVVGGEQHLADGDPVRGEGVGVGLHQPQLPDARRGLRRREVPRALRQLQRGQAGRDRAGGDQHGLPPGDAHPGEDVHERREPGDVETAGQRGEGGRTDLDDDAPRGRDLRTRGGHAAVVRDVVREIVLAPRRLAELEGRPAQLLRREALLRTHAVRRVDAAVGAATAEARGLLDRERAGGQRRLPVEGDLADRDGVALAGTGLRELLLDAEPVEPVGEEADGLVVGEVGLPHPALDADAADDEPLGIVGVALDGEPGVVDGLGGDGDPGGLHRRQAGAVLLDGAGQREAELAQALPRRGAHRVDLEPALLQRDAHEVDELAGIRHVDLVQDGDPQPTDEVDLLVVLPSARARAPRCRSRGRGRAPWSPCRRRAPGRRSARRAGGTGGPAPCPWRRPG